MASLADELGQTDPAFQQQHASFASDGDDDYRSEADSRSAGGVLSPSQSAQTDLGFSLAHELGNGGSLHDQLQAGNSLADEVVGQNSIVNSLDQELDAGGGGLHAELRGAENGSAVPQAAAAEDDESRAQRDREHYLIASEKLTDSVRATDAFLEKLKAVTGSTTNAAQGVPPSASAASVSGVDGTHAGVESSLGSLIRQLRAQSQERESQIRELQEHDRVIRRAFEEGGDLLMALAETYNDDAESLVAGGDASSESDRASMNRREASAFSNSSTDTELSRGLGADESALTANGDPQALHTSTALPSKTSLDELARFQHSTRDLVASLGAVHEHCQIANASINDAARRIRNVRNVLTNWNEELHAVEKGRAWIAKWEAGGEQASAANADSATARPADIRQWTGEQTRMCQRLLDEAHAKARTLLQPIHDPVLDRLAMRPTAATAPTKA